MEIAIGPKPQVTIPLVQSKVSCVCDCGVTSVPPRVLAYTSPVFNYNISLKIYIKKKKKKINNNIYIYIYIYLHIYI